MKIRTKFSLLAIVLLLILGFIISVVLSGFQKIVMKEEIRKRVTSIAHNLSDRVADFVLHSDELAIREALADVKKKEEDMEYAFIITRDGKVLGSTFHKQRFPLELKSANKLDDNDNFSVEVLKTGKGLIHDYAVRILSGLDVELHIGMNEEFVNKILFNMTVTIHLITAVITVLAGAVFFFFSGMVVKPLDNFVAISKEIGNGNFSKKIDVVSYDEIGKLAETFNQMVEKLEKTQKFIVETEKLSVLRQLAAGMAHELKNPMTSIKMIFQSIQDEPETHSLTAEDVKIITEEINRMDKLIKDFLSFAKPEFAKVEPVIIEPIIKRVLTLTGPQFKKKNSRIIFNDLGKKHQVYGDSAQLEQVFFNVVLNALQALNGRDKVVIETFENDGTLNITIEDNGKGIQAEILGKVFEPFFTTKEKGTGLGLAIANSIILNHKGRIDLESEENQGTKVTITLPLLEENKNEINTSC